MRIAKVGLPGVLLVLSIGVGVACGSSDDSNGDNGGTDSGVVTVGDATVGDGGSPGTCVSGTTASCSGPGGCAGTQTCNAGGTGYEACVCGGPGADGGTDGGTIRTPDQLTGLLVWIEASDVATSALGDGGSIVNQFHDHIDAGRPFLYFGSPSTPAELLPTGLHAQPVADVHPFDMFAQSSTATLPSIGSDNFVLEMVVSPNTCSTPPCKLAAFLSSTTGSDCNNVRLDLEVDKVDGVFPCASTHSAQAARSAGAHVFGLERTGATTAAILVDGTATAITLASENMPLLPELSVGGGAMEEGVAELVMLRNPAAGDRDALEAYLKSKYGL